MLVTYCIAVSSSRDTAKIQEGLLVEEVLADAGYSSGEALKALEANNITGYVPNFGQYKPTREGFTYHSEGNYYECERGTKLPYKKTYADRKGYFKKQYRSSAKDCTRCPLRKVCIGARSDYKKIEDAVDKPLYDRMHERLQTPKAKRMKKLRQSTVEPVLGTLVNFLGMKRVNTRGIGLANKCMLIAATCYNLKKLLKFKAPRTNAAVKSLRKRAEKVLQSLLVLLFTAITLYAGYYHRNPLNVKNKEALLDVRLQNIVNAIIDLNRAVQQLPMLCAVVSI